jgi:2-polyprenyl-3-methyl-5-hydroxy-6-metoxy-1,4-benzoquinol methylase
MAQPKNKALCRSIQNGENRMSSYTNFQVDLRNKNSSWTIVYQEIKDNSTILDVGCSSGYFDDILISQKGCTVDGIEMDEKDAKLAAKVCRKIIVGNVEDELFPWDEITAKYDYIMFIDVLEHLIDPAKTLRVISKFLKKDGKIIFSIPNMANGSVRLQLLQGNFDYEKEGLLDATHLHYYTAETIKKMVTDSGLVFNKLNFTTFDTPSKTIKAVLSKIGLTPTAQFKDFINQHDSLIYQYIGVLGMSGKPLNVDSQVQAAIKPKLSYEEQLKSIQDDARSLFAQLESANEVIQARDKEVIRLQYEISKLEHTLFIRLKNKAKRILKKRDGQK